MRTQVTFVVGLFSLLGACTGCDRDATPARVEPSASPSARLVTPPPAPSRVSEPAPTASIAGPAVPFDDQIRKRPVPEQQAAVLSLLQEELGFGAGAVSEVRRILEASDWASFGNPRVSKPAMSRSECHARRSRAKVAAESPECGARNMVRVERASGGHVCVDQFEFPNVACEYPVVWVRASEARGICAALGKRLCDAHEWEGGCAGRVLEPRAEYTWDRLPKVYDQSPRRDRRINMELLHNQDRVVTWAYGDSQRKGVCGTAARKEAKCTTVDWGICPTSSYPAGAFPECVSPAGVYDQHGNVAEHMSLPLRPEEMGGRGWTEMKGSWFAFDWEAPHPDDCRWRAKNWHTTAVDHWNSHRSYHLGFRCCKGEADAPAQSPSPSAAAPSPP